MNELQPDSDKPTGAGVVKASEAVESYIQALQYLPDDEDARHNLELALAMKQQQQQQQQRQQGDKNDPNQKQNQDQQSGQKPGSAAATAEAGR